MAQEFGQPWKKCRRCGTTTPDVKDEVCQDEKICARFAAARSDREFELRIAEERRRKREHPDSANDG